MNKGLRNLMFTVLTALTVPYSVYLAVRNADQEKKIDEQEVKLELQNIRIGDLENANVAREMPLLSASDTISQDVIEYMEMLELAGRDPVVQQIRKEVYASGVSSVFNATYNDRKLSIRDWRAIEARADKLGDDFYALMDRIDSLQNMHVRYPWFSKLDHLKRKPLREQLKAVDLFVDQYVTYKDDKEVHGVAEKWQSAQETVTIASGDCEDFAILKAGCMVYLDIDMDRLFLLITEVDDPITPIREGHCVLVVNVADKGKTPELFILDNTDKGTERGILVPIKDINSWFGAKPAFLIGNSPLKI